MILSSVLSVIIQIFAYILSIYDGIIIIYFLMTWIRKLYGTKLFIFFQKATWPFMKIFSGKLLIGYFDLGATLGLVILNGVITLLYRISYMV